MRSRHSIHVVVLAIRRPMTVKTTAVPRREPQLPEARRVPFRARCMRQMHGMRGAVGAVFWIDERVVLRVLRLGTRLRIERLMLPGSRRCRRGQRARQQKERNGRAEAS